LTKTLYLLILRETVLKSCELNITLALLLILNCK